MKYGWVGTHFYSNLLLITIEVLSPAEEEDRNDSFSIQIFFLLISWTTITPEVYCNFRDNACSHTVAKPKQKIQEFVRELFDYPPYCLDFALWDCFLVLQLKQWLGGQRFETEEELKHWFKSQTANLYAEGLKTLRKILRSERRLCKELNQVWRLLNVLI